MLLISVLAAALTAASAENSSTYETFVPVLSDVRDVEEIETLRLLPASLDIFEIDRLFHVLKGNVSISDKCLTNMFRLKHGLQTRQEWAMRILDSTGSYSSGYLFGNRYWLGSQTECLDLPNHAGTPPPFSLSYFAAKFQVHHNITTHHQVITVGLCLPKECLIKDLTVLLTKLVPSEATVREVRIVPDPTYEFFTEIPLIILGAVALTVCMTVVVGTMYDILYLQRTKHKTLGPLNSSINKEIGITGDKSTKTTQIQFYSPGNKTQRESLSSAESTSSVHSGSSCESQESSKPGTLGQVVLCFSLKRNLTKIFDTRVQDTLGCVHGLRVLSMVWVIAGHTCMTTVPFVDNIGYRIVVERDFLFQTFGNGAFSVDTFFFLSGLLIAFVFYKAEIKRSEQQSARVHARVTSLKLVGGISYRFIRLTPPYLVVMVLSYLLARWFIHNSVFDPPTGDMVTCTTYWWRNLLYINTFFPVNQMCVIWSWYLADDTQFYCIGLLILLLSTKYKLFACISTGVLLTAAWITTAIITLYTNHKPSVEEPLGLFDQLYDKPWTRLGPYVVGMAVGYYLAKVNCQAKFNKVVVVAGWSISMVTTFALVYGLYGQLSEAQSAAYVTFSHTAWGLAISWIVVACVTGYGGIVNRILTLKMFAPLSRLSYCAYLTHPLIMMSVVAHMESPAHLQRDTLIISICGYVLTAYLASLMLTLLFEAPAVALLNIFHPLKKKTT